MKDVDDVLRIHAQIMTRSSTGLFASFERQASSDGLKSHLVYRQMTSRDMQPTIQPPLSRQLMRETAT
jgi:hypothetical protein